MPPLPDQHRIAAFLDRKCAEIDSVIADTQKTIEEYKALKQSIITEAVTKGVRGERKMKDSGVEWIGDVPEEWEVIPVKYVAEFQPSCDMSNLTDDSIITYLPMEHLKNGYYIQNTAFYGSVASSLTPFMNGDIVMAKVTPCFEKWQYCNNERFILWCWAWAVLNCSFIVPLMFKRNICYTGCKISFTSKLLVQQ